MKNRCIAFLVLAGLTAGALSCATQSASTAAPSESQAASPAPAAPPSQEPAVTPAQVAWKDMTKPQRGKYMATVVMPKMKEMFRSFDPKEFAEFNCATCHGPGAKNRSFEMPNPELPVLPGSPEEFAPIMKDKPEWVKFMAEKVTPEMATLLGLPEFDPHNSQPGAFGCPNCHTIKNH